MKCEIKWERKAKEAVNTWVNTVEKRGPHAKGNNLRGGLRGNLTNSET